MAANALKLGFLLSATDNMTGVVDKAVNQSTSKLNKFQRGFQSVGAGIAKFGKVAIGATTAAVTAATAAATAAAKYGDESIKTAQKIGMQTEAWQRLAYAGKMSGVESEALAGSLKIFNKNLFDAAHGGSKELSRALKDLGVSITDATGQMRPSEDVLKDLSDVFASVDDSAAKTKLAMLAFGKSGADMIPFLNTGAESIGAFGKEAEAIGQVFEDHNTTKFVDSFGKLKKTFSGLTMELGRDVMPAFIELFEAVGEGLQRLRPLFEMIGGFFKELVGAIRELFSNSDLKGFFGTIMDTLKPVFNAILQIIQKIFGALGTIMKPLTNLAKVVFDLIGAILPVIVNIIDLILDILAPIIGTIIDLVSAVVELVKTALAPILDVLGDKSSGLMQAIKGVFWVIGNILKAVIMVITALVKVITWVVEAIYTAIGDTWEEIKASFQAFVNFFVDLWDSVVGLFEEGWNNLKAIWEFLPKFFSKLWDGVKQVFNRFWEWLKGLFQKYDPVYLIYKNWDKIKAWFAGLWDGVKGVFTGAWDGIKNFFASLNPVDWLKRVFSKVYLFFADLQAKFLNWGKDIIRGLVDGIKDAAKWVWDAIKDIGQGIADAFTGVLGIHSPSRIFAEYGLNITEGLTGGIERGTDNVAVSTKGMAMSAINETGNYITNNAGTSSVDNRGSGDVTFHYKPTINMSGGNVDEKGLTEVLRLHKRDIEKMIKGYYDSKIRLAFA